MNKRKAERSKTATVTAMSSGEAAITVTYTVGGRIVEDRCTISVQKAASTLSVKNVRYPKKGSVDDFYCTADITSNYRITKVNLYGAPTPDALGISLPAVEYNVIFDSDAYYEVGASETEVITRFFIEKYRSLYEIYVTLVKELNLNPAVTVTITVTWYDTSGNTVCRLLQYTLDER